MTESDEVITGEVPDLKPEQIIAPLSVFEEYTWAIASLDDETDVLKHYLNKKRGK